MASVSPNYEVNVSKRQPNGKYWFYCRIELGQRIRNDAVSRFEELKTIFGNEYKLELIYWDCTGTVLEDI